MTSSKRDDIRNLKPLNANIMINIIQNKKDKGSPVPKSYEFFSFFKIKNKTIFSYIDKNYKVFKIKE